jgi:glycerophosphoryl diester phosphodiesterase
MCPKFDLQGHRGARGLQPENTLPAFEVALDHGVTAIETDVHLTRDDVPVLCHDPHITERLCKLLPNRNAAPPTDRPMVRSLTLEELRCYRADVNPDTARFPNQSADAPPLARAFAAARDMHPYAIPTIADLIAFVAEYEAAGGEEYGKTAEQRAAAARLRFDLELKREPFRPETIGDGFDGIHPSVLEQMVVKYVERAGVAERTIIRSFDHRAVRAVRQLEPNLTTAVLVAGTCPINPVVLVRQADATIYCPEYHFVHAEQVRQCHSEAVRVVPWTVNAPDDMKRLLDWQVDGITTDFPDRLRQLVGERANRSERVTSQQAGDPLTSRRKSLSANDLPSSGE